ncbi:response regulator [Anabaena azotica]|uniref:response regulator n=1 Tax=Anabaena azotica TaxID=197653 RepID=UPI0039A42A36
MNSSIASTFTDGILKDLQILVVDNDVDSGVLYTIFLTQFGANVMTSSSIEGALEVLRWFVPNIIICEIRFLGESVYKLFKKLSAMEAVNRNYIPVIVTSTSSTGVISEVPEIELERYLLKPVDLDQLILMITKLFLTGKNNLSDCQPQQKGTKLMKLKGALLKTYLFK